MQILSANSNVPQPSPARANREPVRTGVEQVQPVTDDDLQDLPRQQAESESQQPEVPEKPEVESENYRLNFDQEKRRIYLELLNPVTGDVIQRVPRDDLAFAFAPNEEKSPQGVNVTV
ncbi:MAG: hypothetical protein V7788_04465 [Alphaproteobacteria bacterium]